MGRRRCEMFTYEGIEIRWLGHDGFKLKKGKRNHSIFSFC